MNWSVPCKLEQGTWNKGGEDKVECTLEKSNNCMNQKVRRTSEGYNEIALELAFFSSGGMNDRMTQVCKELSDMAILKEKREDQDLVVSGWMYLLVKRCQQH